jgi:uncharacterized protein DUF3467
MARSNETKAAENTEQVQQPKSEQITQAVRWDDSNLKSSYANVCNVSSTRSEIVLVFGINHDWERGQREVKIQLSDRIILSPFAAKRLAELLNNVVRQYELRFGSLDEAQPSPEAVPSSK